MPRRKPAAGIAVTPSARNCTRPHIGSHGAGESGHHGAVTPSLWKPNTKQERQRLKPDVTMEGHQTYSKQLTVPVLCATSSWCFGWARCAGRGVAAEPLLLGTTSRLTQASFFWALTLQFRSNHLKFSEALAQ